MSLVALAFDRQCQLAGLPVPVAEYAFAQSIGRRWRFDWAWPSLKLAVEQEGGVWTKGRHTRGAGFVKDLEKYNRAAELGWRLLRFTPEQIDNGMALDVVERIITGTE